MRTGGIGAKDVALPLMAVEIGVIDAHVADQYGIEATDLAKHGHRDGPAKLVAVELACRLTGMRV